MKQYTRNQPVLVGMSLKNEQQPEQNNMALHICENTAAIITNRIQLASTIGYQLDDFVCAQQTHSANFYKVEQKDRGRGALSMESAIPNTDALYTYEAGIVLTSFSADCVPILMHNTQTGVIAAVHSGWQGTVKEIIPHLLQQLITIEQNPAEAFHVWINPALSQQKFEVDRDVYESFVALGYAEEFMYFKEETNKYHIDNQLVVKKQCELAGIPSTHITLDTTCTFIHDDSFSYRQNKQAGRHLSFIVKK